MNTFADQVTMLLHGNLVVPFACSATMQTHFLCVLVQQPRMDFQ